MVNVTKNRLMQQVGLWLGLGLGLRLRLRLGLGLESGFRVMVRVRVRVTIKVRVTVWVRSSSRWLELCNNLEYSRGSMVITVRVRVTRLLFMARFRDSVSYSRSNNGPVGYLQHSQ